ncbi:unnamed protein product [Prorocentrum cordatum]|uniref:Uncharacterized protein n=2 Tax=Prorocentrum cordatum TaxID=2364126 RepID=A0ABN9XYI2_9DINO|nr:unnamed protein product [Polarella glacialis]
MLQAEACRRRRRSETQGRKEHRGVWGPSGAPDPPNIDALPKHADRSVPMRMESARKIGQRPDVLPSDPSMAGRAAGPLPLCARGLPNPARTILLGEPRTRMVLAKTTKSAARMLTLICSLRMCHQATSDDPVSTGIREDTAKRLNQTVALDYAFSSKRDGTSLSKFVQHDRRCLAQKSLRLRTMQEPLAGCHACAEARSPGIRGSPMWSTPAPRSRSTSYIYIHSSLPRARGRGQPCLWEDLSRAAGAARPRCQRWALPPSPLARQAPDSGG